MEYFVVDSFAVLKNCSLYLSTKRKMKKEDVYSKKLNLSPKFHSLEIVKAK